MSLQQANQTLDETKANVRVLRGELEKSQVRERKTAEATEAERRVARENVAKLEGVTERADREHTLFRERTEGRLEQLRLAAEEARENAFQVCVRACSGRSCVWWPIKLQCLYRINQNMHFFFRIARSVPV